MNGTAMCFKMKQRLCLCALRLGAPFKRKARNINKPTEYQVDSHKNSAKHLKYLMAVLGAIHVNDQDWENRFV